jgi:amino acid adenylation domain-containing protein/FkbM family methyltransferase
MASHRRNLPDLVRQDRAVADHTAIVAPGIELSYREMWDRVRAVERLLCEAGVRPGDRIGLFFTRSADYVISLLATLLSGAIAVPLDAELPKHRVDRIVRIARPRTVLYSAVTPPFDGRMDIGSAHSYEIPPPQDDSNVKILAGLSEGPAIVVFTSGSTGSPKGVVLHHAGVGNRLLWGHDRYGFDESDRVLHKASIGFDAAIHEIFAPLIAGGALVIAPPDLQFDSRALVRLIQESRITTAHFVPSMLRHVVAEPEFGGCTSLRRVFCGGEALEMHLVRRFRNKLTARLFNQYGPTEASVSVTYWDCSEDYGGAIAPLGRPIWNVRCHVLESDMKPVPPGTVGELWISGVAVGSGYLDDEEQTELRLRDDPFGTDGGRIYRTGDLVRLAPAGYLEFLGRVDDQLKIRGVRVEPEEVAAAIREHPLVSDAATIGAKNDAGDTELIAYVQAHTRNSPLVGGMARVPLPNGLAVVSPSPDEAQYLYRQIFDNSEYGRFGIGVRANGVVVDVGANIGLFTLWAAHRAPGLKVFAVEPNPDVLPYLSANLQLYEIDAEIIPLAVSETVGSAQLTSFRGLTYLSGLGNRNETASSLLKSYYRAERVGARRDLSPNDIGALLQHAEERLVPTIHTVETVDLATLLDRHGVGQIDLLKLNIEGSEFAAIRRLRPEQWHRVGQICLEVENASRTVPQIKELLTSMGFVVHEQADWNLGPEADVAYVYGLRPGANSVRPKEWHCRIEPMLNVKDLRAFLADRLSPAAMPSRVVFVQELPRLPNGKVSRQDLAQLSRTPGGRQESRFEADLRNRMREVWRGTLMVDEVNDDDNFLLLGGHSLMALRVSLQLREALGINAAPMTFLSAPTFADWYDEVIWNAGVQKDAH